MTTSALPGLDEHEPDARAQRRWPTAARLTGLEHEMLRKAATGDRVNIVRARSSWRR